MSTTRCIKFKWSSWEGELLIQALPDELKEAKVPHDINMNSNGTITHLFFTHPKSIELLRSHPTTILIDCTYKTNKYKMPLLNAVGNTSLNSSFFCFVLFF